MHGAHEHLQPDDGVDDNNEEDQEGDLDQRDECHDDSIENHLKARYSGHQAERSEHSKCSQCFCIKPF